MISFTVEVYKRGRDWENLINKLLKRNTSQLRCAYIRTIQYISSSGCLKWYYEINSEKQETSTDLIVPGGILWSWIKSNSATKILQSTVNYRKSHVNIIFKATYPYKLKLKSNIPNNR